MAESTPEETAAEPKEEKDPDEAAAKAKEKQARRSYGDRALASLRQARRGQREIDEPVENTRLLLAEANVLALLAVADELSNLRSGSESE